MKVIKPDNTLNTPILEKIERDILPLNDLVEIHTSGIDIDEIMAQLQENIHSRQVKARENGFDIDSLIHGEDRGFPSSSVDQEIQYALYQVDYLQDRILVKPSIEPYSSSILNALFTPVRYFFHNLAIYYVNMMAKRQVLFNQAVADILNKLTEELRISRQNELQSELVELRRRLADLETKLKNRS